MSWISIDMGLVSPAMCVWDKKTNHLIVYFTPKTRKQRGLVVKGALTLPHARMAKRKWEQKKKHACPWRDQGSTDLTYQLEAMEPDDKTLPLFERYTRRVDSLIQRIEKAQAPYTIRIEGYAFGIQNSSSVSRLYEVGGILRYEMYKKGWQYEEIAPTAIKSFFSGTGLSDKYDMYTQWRKLELPNLFDVLQCKKGSKETSEKNKTTPKPIEDIVDAAALGIYTYYEEHQKKCNTCAPLQKTKRKAEDGTDEQPKKKKKKTKLKANADGILSL